MAVAVDAQPTNIRVSPAITGDFYPPEEVSIAINPSTTISYQTPRSGDVRLAVYDLLGREVARLFDGSRSAGFY
jgi:hypothetical protein